MKRVILTAGGVALVALAGLLLFRPRPGQAHRSDAPHACSETPVKSHGQPAAVPKPAAPTPGQSRMANERFPLEDPAPVPGGGVPGAPEPRREPASNRVVSVANPGEFVAIEDLAPGDVRHVLDGGTVTIEQPPLPAGRPAMADFAHPANVATVTVAATVGQTAPGDEILTPEEFEFIKAGGVLEMSTVEDVGARPIYVVSASNGQEQVQWVNDLSPEEVEFIRAGGVVEIKP